VAIRNPLASEESCAIMLASVQEFPIRREWVRIKRVR
jgi:hypothetical protein